MPLEISWTLVVLYLVIVLAIGIWAARTRISSVEDMAVTGRQSGILLIALSVAATWINGVTLIATSGLGKNFGLGAYWNGGAFMIATIWLGYYLIPRLRQTGIITVPQFFARYFGSETHVLSLMLSMLRDLGATAGVMGALAIVTANIFQISIVEALLATYVLMLVYVFLGGMWAVMVSDSFQFLIVFVSSIWLTVLAFSKVGGMSGINSQVGSQYLEVIGPAGLTQITGWVVIGLAITLGYQSIIQRGLSAASSDIAKKGFLIGGVIGFFWYMVPPLMGVVARALYGPDIPADEVFLKVTFDLGGQGATIVVISILAASMSTLDSTVNTIASNFSVDIYSRYINPAASERKQLWIYRVNVAFVGLLAAVIYFLIPMMLELFWIGGRIMGASLTPALVGLVLFPRTRKAPRAVFWSMVSGALIVTCWQLLGSVREVSSMVVVWTFDPILVGLPISILILWIGTHFETRRNSIS